jgi:hypothetical protein
MSMPPRDQLVLLRLEQNKSVKLIAEHFNVSLPLAKKWLRTYDIRKYPAASSYPSQPQTRQLNVMIGSLLGDAHLEKVAGLAKNSLFKKKQCVAQEEYLFACYELLKPFLQS